MFSPVNKINKFNENIGIYISEKVASEIFMRCSLSKDKIGYLTGDIQFFTKRPYVLVTGSFSDIYGIEHLDEEIMVVGWYYCGIELPQEGKGADIEKRLFSRPHHIMLSINPEKRQIKAYKRRGKDYIKTSYEITEICRTTKQTLGDELLIENEVSEIKEAKKMLEFTLLSFFSILFGIFGGLLGFFVGNDQGIRRRIFLIIFGVISTIFWLMLGKSII